MSQADKFQGDNFFKKAEIHPRLNGLLSGGDSQQKTFGRPLSSRFKLQLSKTTEKEFPEFNYIDLIRSQENLHREADGLQSPFPEDDTDKLQALAKKFEDKYGPSKKKGGSYVNEFVDIGYGYDESDSFLDNSEAYDEVVPSDWTTALGGFYINAGDLDFRPLTPEKMDISRTDESKENMQKIKKKKKSAGLKVKKDILSQKSKNKFLSHGKQRKRQESLLKAQKILNKKKKKTLPANNNTLEAKDKSFEDDVPLSKICKDQTNEKKTSKTNSQDEDIPLAKITNKNENSNLNNSNASAKVVVSSANANQNANDSTKSNTKEEVALPENLPQELINDIEKLKKISVDSVKGKFFNDEVNQILLSFAKNSRILPAKIRNVVFDHIIFYLPCGKDTLTKRCRRLLTQYQKDLEDGPMKALEKAISDSMPEQKKAHEEEVAKHLQEQAKEQMKQAESEAEKSGDGETSNVDGEDKNKKGPPKKKYAWTDVVRKALWNVVKVRVALYKMSKTKSSTPEEYIKEFLESEIRGLWPKGWMTSRILYKESRLAHSEITQPSKAKKAAKNSEGTQSENTSSSTNAVVTSTKTLPSSSSQHIENTKQTKPITSKSAASKVTVTTTPIFLQAKVLSAVSSNTSNTQLNLTQSDKVIVSTEKQKLYTASVASSNKKSDNKIKDTITKKCIIIATSCDSSTLEKLKQGNLKFMTSSNKPIYLSTSTGVTKLSPNLKLVDAKKSLGHANSKLIASMMNKNIAKAKVISDTNMKSEILKDSASISVISRTVSNKVTALEAGEIQSGSKTIFSEKNITASTGKSVTSTNATISKTSTVISNDIKVSSFVAPSVISKPKVIDVDYVSSKRKTESTIKQIKRKSSFEDNSYMSSNKRMMQANSVNESSQKNLSNIVSDLHQKSLSNSVINITQNKSLNSGHDLPRKSWADVETDLARMSTEAKMSKILATTKNTEPLTELSFDDVVNLDKAPSTVIRKAKTISNSSLNELDKQEIKVSRSSISQQQVNKPELIHQPASSIKHTNPTNHQPRVCSSEQNFKLPMHPSLALKNKNRALMTGNLQSVNKESYFGKEIPSSPQSPHIYAPPSSAAIQNSVTLHPASRLSHQSSGKPNTQPVHKSSKDRVPNIYTPQNPTSFHQSPIKMSHSYNQESVLKTNQHSAISFTHTSPVRNIKTNNAYLNDPNFIHQTMKQASTHAQHPEILRHTMRNIPLDNIHTSGRSSIDHQQNRVSSSHLHHGKSYLEQSSQGMRSIDHPQHSFGHAQLHHPVIFPEHSSNTNISSNPHSFSPPKPRRLSKEEEEILQIQHDLMRSRNASDTTIDLDRYHKFN